LFPSPTDSVCALLPVQAVQVAGLVVLSRAISVQAGQTILVNVTPEVTVAVAQELIENHTTSIEIVFGV